MKRNILIVVVLLTIAIAIVYSQRDGNTVEYIKETVTEEVKVDALEAAIRDAITASSTQTEATAQKAYDDAKRQAEVEIELAVTAQYRAKLQAREKELQKESVAYWREIANVKRLIRETFPDEPIMVEVARLESGFRHYMNEDGSRVLQGRVTPADTGVMQINCNYWCDDALRLGYDLTNIVDNVAMARYIYDTQGITAWVAFNQHLSMR